MAGYGIGAPTGALAKDHGTAGGTNPLDLYPVFRVVCEGRNPFGFLVGGVVRSSSDGRCSALNHRRRVSEKRKQRGALAFPFVSFFYDEPRIFTWRINYLSSLTKIGFE